MVQSNHILKFEFQDAPASHLQASTGLERLCEQMNID